MPETWICIVYIRPPTCKSIYSGISIISSVNLFVTMAPGWPCFRLNLSIFCVRWLCVRGTVASTIPQTHTHTTHLDHWLTETLFYSCIIHRVNKYDILIAIVFASIPSINDAHAAIKNGVALSHCLSTIRRLQREMHTAGVRSQLKCLSNPNNF